MTRRRTQTAAESERPIAQAASGRFEEASRKLALAACGTSVDVSRLLVLPDAAEGGLHDMQRSATDLVEGVVQANLRAAQELARLGDPADVVELQQRFVREYLDALMQGTVSLLRAIHRAADQTLHPLEEQLEERQQSQRDEQHDRTATA